jgi:AcrR family transcriptional regulator
MEQAETVSEKQREIVRAAATVFARYGYHKTAMKDIIAASRVSRATVYKYFKSKDDVFRAVIWLEKKEAISELRRGVEAETSTRGKLKAILATSLRMMDEKVNLYRLTMSSFTELFPRGEDEHREMKMRVSEMREMLAGVLRDGAERGEVVLKDVDLAADVFLTAFRGIMIGAFVRADERPAVELAEAVVNLFMDGLAAKGEA